MNSIYKLITLSALIVGLTGCASQAKDVDLSENFWHDHTQTVAVAEDTKPTPGLDMRGQGGLIDLAVNAAMASQFETYLESSDMTWMEGLQTTLIATLDLHNIKTVKVAAPITLSKLDDSKQDNTKFAVKQFSPLAIEVGHDKLLVITLNKYGAVRNYYGFIPLGAPSAVVDITGRLVNVETNEILWRHHAIISTNVDGDWDQAPNYPNFTKALNAAVTTAKEELVDSLQNNA